MVLDLAPPEHGPWLATAGAPIGLGQGIAPVANEVAPEAHGSRKRGSEAEVAPLGQTEDVFGQTESALGCSR